MNKNEIKQIILEEIEAAINEMASPEQLAADSRPEEDDFSLEDEMEMARDFNDEQDAIFGKPNFVEEEGLEEMARTSNVFKLSQEASMKDVLQFMQRVNDVLKTYKSPGQKRPKKRFTPEEMKALATAMLKPEGFTSKDVIAATTYNSPAQANKFLKALEMKGLITLTSQLKKSMEPTRDPNAPETRGRKAKSAEFDVPDDALDMDFGDFDDLDLSDPLAETTTMTNLEKYIKQQIREAKNPLAKKMKEIENQGRRAALETKLAAIEEMIEETQGRLTRIDEDNEFRDMMDKNAVKEVRKQLKELERAKAKLQKEYGKMKKMALPKDYDGEKGKVMDEEAPVAEDTIDEDAIENAIDEVELEEDDFKLNERSGFPLDEMLKTLQDIFGGNIEIASPGYPDGKATKLKVDTNNYLSQNKGAFQKYEDWIEDAKKAGIKVSMNDGVVTNYNKVVARNAGEDLNESMLRMQKLANIIKG